MSSLQPRIQLRIVGMDCANCARTLERSLAQLDGVSAVEVNFATTNMVATGSVDLDAVRSRIRALGYDVADVSDTPGALASATPAPTGIRGFFSFLRSTRQGYLALVSAALLLLTSPAALVELPSSLLALMSVLHVAVIVLAGFPIARRGFQALVVSRQITIDLLMSIATVGALLIGETGEAATVIVLFSMGEALEGYTADRARDSLRSLLALTPDQAHVLRSCIDCDEHLGQQGYGGGPCPFCGTHAATVPVREVLVGDTVVVHPGERIPVDGYINSGASSLNQAPITGESIPVAKSAGDEVYAGAINGDGVLEIQVTRPAADSTISRIVRLVEQAQSQRSPVERFVDRFARWYTPTVVGAAILLAAIPPLVFGQPFLDAPDGARGWLYRALALLIVACPCALVISTPVTMVSSLTSLARRGVLVKGGVFLDALARIRTFAFDKTGTLTAGQPMVVDVHAADCIPGQARCDVCDDMVAVAAAVETRSGHPLAHAILAEAKERGVYQRYSPAADVQSLTGRGVRGSLNGDSIVVGSHTYFHDTTHNCELLHEKVAAAEQRGQTVMLISRNEQVLGFVTVADQARLSSRSALQALKQLDGHIRTVMLTGDNPTVASAIARSLDGLDEIRAGLMPEDKLDVVKQLEAQYGPVAMIGDGVNDAPALAAASVGVAMGGAGTAQAMETADIVLMQDNLAHLPDAVLTSRRTRSIIQQNIAFSLAIKLVFLLLTLPGFATLWMAVFADMGASLLVTLNGMRMLRLPKQSL